MKILCCWRHRRRFDHTLANLQTVAYGLEHGVFVMIADQDNMITMLRD